MLPAFHPSEVDSDRTNRIDIEPPVASSLNQHPTLRPCTLMDVLNGLHTEHDYESKPNKSGNRPSKACDRARLRVRANKHANRPPKAKSFLRRSYDWYPFDITPCYSIRPADINKALERLPTTFQWETNGLSHRHISKALTCYEIGQQADYNHWLERLLIEASVTPLLLCPIHGYQHPRWSTSERQRPQPIDVSEPRCQTL